MIKTETEYLEAKKRLEQESQDIELYAEKMKNAGISDDLIHLAIDPLASFKMQLAEEVEEYEKLKRGYFEPLENFLGIGRTLVSLRISKGLKQKDLASLLGVKEAQVSRDERNEYHGASIEKVQKVLEALGVKLTTQIYAYSKKVS